MKSIRIFAISLLILAVLSGCLGYQAPKEAAPAPAAGGAKADFKIVSPTEGATITGDSVTITLEPINVAIKPAGGPVKEDEGHFHITLDTGGYSPTAAASKTYNGLSPGQHTITVELMYNDHSPRSPRVLKKVTFTIASQTGGAVMTTQPPATTVAPSPYRY